MEGKIRVTKQMEFTIIKLHQEGLGYVKIGQALGLKRDQVRYVCKKYEKTTDKNAAKKDIPGRCVNCGARFLLRGIHQIRGFAVRSAGASGVRHIPKCMLTLANTVEVHLKAGIRKVCTVVMIAILEPDFIEKRILKN